MIIPQRSFFRNTILNVSVSLTATYKVDEVGVEREEVANESASTDYSKFITPYKCDELNMYTKETTTYNQGDDITIYITNDSIGVV